MLRFAGTKRLFMSKRLFLVFIVFSTFLTFTETPITTANALSHTDIDVDIAYQMITNGTYPNLVILDV
jgi:hypothetical protein